MKYISLNISYFTKFKINLAKIMQAKIYKLARIKNQIKYIYLACNFFFLFLFVFNLYSIYIQFILSVFAYRKDLTGKII